MRRALLFGVGTLLGLAAGGILSRAPDLYQFTDAWHSAGLTRTVGLAYIAEGAFAALGSALCLGRAVAPLRPAPGGHTSGGGPVLPLCGVLFLLAATGPFGQARWHAELLAVEESMPGRWGNDIVEADRRQERTAWAFATLWLAAGGGLLATPLFLDRRTWHLAWPVDGVGCGVAAGGLLLSGLGALVWLANGLALEGANAELSLAGYLGVFTGAAVALGGGVLAIARHRSP